MTVIGLLLLPSVGEARHGGGGSSGRRQPRQRRQMRPWAGSKQSRRGPHMKPDSRRWLGWARWASQGALRWVSSMGLRRWQPRRMAVSVVVARAIGCVGGDGPTGHRSRWWRPRPVGYVNGGGPGGWWHWEHQVSRWHGLTDEYMGRVNVKPDPRYIHRYQPLFIGLGYWWIYFELYSSVPTNIYPPMNVHPFPVVLV
jgi:hypothetical protein